jgi:hypothetical protein
VVVVVGAAVVVVVVVAGQDTEASMAAKNSLISAGSPGLVLAQVLILSYFLAIAYSSISKI